MFDFKQFWKTMSLKIPRLQNGMIPLFEAVGEANSNYYD